MLLFFCGVISAIPSWGFQYGQCLLGRSESYNLSLRNYKNVALATAQIKKISLEKNPLILKWNYETTRLVYDLIVLRPYLKKLSAIYRRARDLNPEALRKIQNYLSEPSGHLALAEAGGPTEPLSQDLTRSSLEQLVDLLDEHLPEDKEVDRNIRALREAASKPTVRNAVADFYDRLQEALVGATPIEPASVDQWIKLGRHFESQLFVKDCKQCQAAITNYNGLILDWFSSQPFPAGSSDFTRDYIEKLPPMMMIKYPTASERDPDASKLIKFYYTRSIEQFLLGPGEIDLKAVTDWMAVDPNYKIILRQAEGHSEAKLEKDTNKKLLTYILSQERVMGNAFDHFVWNGQQGSDFEKSIDGVARTIYGEAESCQMAGSHQFEAIGSVIAGRSISVDLQNKKNNLYKTIIDYAIFAINKLTPLELEPFSAYHRGASDFGRGREVISIPEISGMSTPAQVVSKPVQFSVWKLGKKEDFEAARWIKWPADLGYPAGLSISISGPVSEDLDPAQKKVLCPRGSIFSHAVDVATAVVTDYYSYANTYRFYQGDKRVIPYFYTHRPSVRLKFVRPMNPTPSFIKVVNGEEGGADKNFVNLPLLKGNMNCQAMKFYGLEPNDLVNGNPSNSQKARR